MPAVLVVEDSQVVLKVLRHLSRKMVNFDFVYVTTRAEGLKQLEQGREWFAAIVDLTLPDAPDGEMVKETLARKIPTIVLTSSVSDEKREQLMRSGVVDYVLKEGRFSYQYALNLVNRLYRNQDIQVLVAEDSTTTRKVMVELLKRHLFQVHEAEDGQQALKQLQQHPEIKLLLTDYHMPNLDGVELIQAIRQHQEQMDLGIIGLSAEGDSRMSAKFIKNGANDFLHKPFSEEEFFCRIIQSVDGVERIEQMRSLAYQDYLTGMPNRRGLMEQGQALLQAMSSDQANMALALIEIDEFKDILDTYGQDAGDLVAVHFAQLFKDAFHRFQVARLGDDKFCALMKGLSNQQATRFVDSFRQQLEFEQAVMEDGQPIHYSVSAGVTNNITQSMDDMVRAASVLLGLAKDEGSNLVMGDTN